MFASFLRRQLGFLVLCLALLWSFSFPLYAAESPTLLAANTIAQSDQNDLQADTLSLDMTDPDDEFNLARYYDDLEPPDQGGFWGRYSVLAEDTLYFAIPGVALIGILYMLPESVSKWDRDDLSWDHLWDNWTENVTSWEWDDDEDWINYIGHPYFGSAYFVHARHYGYSRMESLGYAFVMSSIYEIVLEAWAEPVSIQDMFVTPLLGWGLAEILLPLEYKIKQNNSEVLNSRILGSVSLFLIDPFGHIILPLKRWTKGFFADDTEMSLRPSIGNRNIVNDQGIKVGTDECYKLTFTVNW